MKIKNFLKALSGKEFIRDKYTVDEKAIERLSISMMGRING